MFHGWSTNVEILLSMIFLGKKKKQQIHYIDAVRIEQTHEDDSSCIPMQ